MSYGLAAATSLGFATFTFAFLSVNFSDEHAPLKWLFMILSVATASFSAIIMSTIATAAGHENIGNMIAYVGYGFLIILTFTIAYFLIIFITKSLEKTTKQSYGENSAP